MERPGAGERGGVDDGPCGVGGAAAAAVGAVGVSGLRRYSRRAVERRGEGQGVLLIGAAAALATDGHGQLTSGQNDRFTPAPLKGESVFCLLCCNLAGLALDAVAEHDRLVTRVADDGLGERDVALDERLHRAIKLALDHGAHLQDAVLQRGDLALELLTRHRRDCLTPATNAGPAGLRDIEGSSVRARASGGGVGPRQREAACQKISF